MVPVVNYDRMQRIHMAIQEPKTTYFNRPTRFCLLIMFVVACILYKRWKDKQARINQKISY